MFGKSLLCPLPLDPDFIPAAVFLNDYQDFVLKSPHKSILQIDIYRKNVLLHTACIPICIEWERSHHFFVCERVFKTCLWMVGGDAFFVDGCPGLSDFLANKYSLTGDRKFDADLIGQKSLHRSFEFLQKKLIYSPSKPHLQKFYVDGQRIGLDLGGSDIKFVAIKDGVILHAEEISWNPYPQTDPQWHLQKILAALQKAAQFLSKVDSIGISMPGILIDEVIQISALFQGLTYEDFLQYIQQLRSFLQFYWPHVPIHMCNDGDAAALFGSYEYQSKRLLALSLGTSVAGGFVSSNLQILGWFNELAFIPIDFSPHAVQEPWSADRGCAASYLSQQGVFRLAMRENLISPYCENTQKLEWIQEQFLNENPKAITVFETLGIYLGYTIAYLAKWYQMDSILLLGRVCSKQSGQFLTDVAQKVLHKEFSHISETLQWKIPKKESQKRMSQAIAAAYLSGPL